jgi:CheY-like chemotaxis protein
VVLEVEDSGCGIPPDRIGRIFDPFFTTKRVGAGSGLGLTLTHDIVTTHRGRVDVSSEPGVGTKVTMRLPAAPRTAEASGPAEPVADRPRVLVVDDEPALRRSYRRVLEEDFEVREAGGTDEAIAVLGADADFDVVLCDLHMPGRSGAALYREVEARWPDLSGAFLFITGGAFTDETREIASRYEERCLAKPVPAEVLIDRIRGHANRS